MDFFLNSQPPPRGERLIVEPNECSRVEKTFTTILHRLLWLIENWCDVVCDKCGIRAAEVASEIP